MVTSVPAEAKAVQEKCQPKYVYHLVKGQRKKERKRERKKERKREYGVLTTFASARSSQCIRLEMFDFKNVSKNTFG